MSIPRKWTVWGKIEYKGNEYDMLSYPLIDDIQLKFHESYKKYINKLTMITPYNPWKNKNATWLVENNKLYLTGLIIKDGNTTSINVLSEIFQNEEKIFATWVSQTIRIKLKSSMFDEYELYDELHIKLVNGVIESTENVQNKYKTLRCYVEE